MKLLILHIKTHCPVTGMNLSFAAFGQQVVLLLIA